MTIVRHAMVAVGCSVVVLAAGPQKTARETNAAALPEFCAAYPQRPESADWQSTRVFTDANGRLAYAADADGNRIPDYSYAGYRYGEVPLPSVAEVLRLTPQPGDQTARIQAALDEVGQRPLNAEGIRGAVVLAPGVYEIHGTVNVRHSGLVLRGSGDGSDPATSTILRAPGDTPHQRDVIRLGSGVNAWTESTRTNITTALVPVGSKSVEVENASLFSIGDAIVVHHPSTQAWIDALGGGGVVSSAKWQPGQIDIVYYRKITAIAGNTITFDAPVFNHLDRRLSQSYVARVDERAYISNAAVENLRIDIVTASPEDENHAWNGVYVQGAVDSWIRGITALHFGYAGVRIETGMRITVESSRALDPHAIRTGSRMYNFSSDRRASLVLFKHCEATDGRHNYISNGVSVASGLVYYRSSQRGGDSEAGHRMWATGVLFDNHVEQTSGRVLAINRGDFGTSHGWGTAHSTIWKYNGEIGVQRPPTAQNYGISDRGRLRSSFSFPGPRGWEELRTTARLVPESLYEAQLCDRLRADAKVPTTPSGLRIIR